MLRRSQAERIKENAVSASELALQLARDKKFLKRLRASIEHSSEAGRRTRRGLGLTGMLRRLATDQALLAELSSARHDLQRAYRRLEAKRRTHKLRNFTLLVGVASLATVPQLREWIAGLIANIRSKQRRTDVTTSVGSSDLSGSRSRPGALEELTKEELYARAQEANIPGRSEMSKEQLIDALRASR